MRLPCIAILALALGLSGCGGESYGTATNGFFLPQIGDAYIALQKGNIFDNHDAAAVVIAPGIAVTNAHNANIVDKASVIGRSTDYDLLYFHTAKTATLPTAAPAVGEDIIAYGQGADGELRVAHGVVRLADSKQHGLAFDTDAGPGFSGGPVVDAKSGALLGISFGYLEGQPGVQGRLMYAYDMDRIAAELARIEGPPDHNNR